jgi:hypothetical protein
MTDIPRVFVALNARHLMHPAKVHEGVNSERPFCVLWCALRCANGLITGLNYGMEKKIFWISFSVFGLAADFLLPIWWALLATIPIAYASWWIAYRSDWF